MRLTDSFSYGDFRKSVAEYVRKGHVQTTKHWRMGQLQKLNPQTSRCVKNTGEVLVKVRVDKEQFSDEKYVWLEFKDL